VGQVLGLLAFVVGLAVLAGTAWALLAGGLVTALVCALVEAGELDRQRAAAAASAARGA
jgi:hypothetical protein